MEEQSEQNGRTFVWEKKITLGNLIQIIVLLVAIVMAYSRLQAAQELMHYHIETQRQMLEALKQDLSQQYIRSDVHNEQLRAINIKLQDIQDDINDIKQSVKRR